MEYELKPDPVDLDAKKPWPMWLRVLLLVFTGLFLCCCVPDCLDFVGGVADIEEMDTPELRAAATAFGKRGTDAACEKEAFERLERCKDNALSQDGDGILEIWANLTDFKFQCFSETILFHKHCLPAATPHEEFCELRAVPSTSMLDAINAGQQLETSVCSKLYNYHENGCTQIVRASWQYCLGDLIGDMDYLPSE